IATAINATAIKPVQQRSSQHPMQQLDLKDAPLLPRPTTTPVRLYTPTRMPCDNLECHVPSALLPLVEVIRHSTVSLVEYVHFVYLSLGVLTASHLYPSHCVSTYRSTFIKFAHTLNKSLLFFVSGLELEWTCVPRF